RPRGLGGGVSLLRSGKLVGHIDEHARAHRLACFRRRLELHRTSARGEQCARDQPDGEDSPWLPASARRAQRSPFGLARARSMSSVMSSVSDSPLRCHISGYIENGVTPGIVLTSLTSKSPPSA